MTEAAHLDDDTSPFSRFIGLEHDEITDQHAITRLQTEAHHLNPTGASTVVR